MLMQIKALTCLFRQRNNISRRHGCRLISEAFGALLCRAMHQLCTFLQPPLLNVECPIKSSGIPVASRQPGSWGMSSAALRVSLLARHFLQASASASSASKLPSGGLCC
jgi:hypothetical protein